MRELGRLPEGLRGRGGVKAFPQGVWESGWIRTREKLRERAPDLEFSTTESRVRPYSRLPRLRADARAL